MEDRLIRIEDKLEKILVQTTKTNGRVDSLEERQDKHETIINDLSANRNEIKGRDKMIWIIITAISAVAMLIIGHYL